MYFVILSEMLTGNLRKKKKEEKERKKERTLTHESNTSENNYTNLKGTESCRNYISQGWFPIFKCRIRQSVKRSTGTILHIQANIVPHLYRFSTQSTISSLYESLKFITVKNGQVS